MIRRLKNYWKTRAFLELFRFIICDSDFFIHSIRKRRDIPNILPPLHIDNVPIKREFVRKFLGVYLDEGISWKDHINAVSTKVCNSIGILYATRQIQNKFLRKQLYFSFYTLLLTLHKNSMDQYKQK